MLKKNIFLLLLIYTVCFKLSAQSYHALNGSAYAGSLGITNNPAALVNSAYKWDFTLLGVNAKVSTSTVELRNNELKLSEPFASRYLHGALDVSLFNFHYKPNNREAVGFNLRTRGYIHVNTQPFSFTEPIRTMNDFFIRNRATPFLDFNVLHTGWVEADFNYSKIVHETPDSRLTGGATLQIMKSISGAFVRVNKFSYLEFITGPDSVYNFTGGTGIAAYSANFDNPNTGSGINDFLKNTPLNLGLSLGVEYLIYDQARTSYHINNSLNYKWKIGISLMDLGANKYNTSEFSSQFIGAKPNISDVTFDNKIENIQNAQGLRDSLATVFQLGPALESSFKIGLPTRLVFNIDRSFGNNLYANADLSLNFHKTTGYKKRLSRELNLLTITPRWETINWGVYVPVQYNAQGQIHVGAAVKLGPLTIGVHNIKLIYDPENLSGGGYMLLRIHPFQKKKVLTSLDCPE